MPPLDESRFLFEQIEDTAEWIIHPHETSPLDKGTRLL
jgi:hypothetical protein